MGVKITEAQKSILSKIVSKAALNKKFSKHADTNENAAKQI